MDQAVLNTTAPVAQHTMDQAVLHILALVGPVTMAQVVRAIRDPEGVPIALQFAVRNSHVVPLPTPKRRQHNDGGATT